MILVKIKYGAQILDIPKITLGIQKKKDKKQKKKTILEEKIRKLNIQYDFAPFANKSHELD